MATEVNRIPGKARTRPDNLAHVPTAVYDALSASGMTDAAILVHMPAPKAKGVAGKPTLKVGAKGGVCVYGIGRFPVTLYREQWERLLGEADNIRAFIAANASVLKAKGDEPREVPAETPKA
jgi:hypothetical protein